MDQEAVDADVPLDPAVRADVVDIDVRTARGLPFFKRLELELGLAVDQARLFGVRLAGHRDLLLTVRHGLDLLSGHAPLDEIRLHGLGPFLAELQVVGDGPGLVGVPADGDLIDLALVELRHGLVQLFSVLRPDLVHVKTEIRPDMVGDLFHFLQVAEEHAALIEGFPSGDGVGVEDRALDVVELAEDLVVDLAVFRAGELLVEYRGLEGDAALGAGQVSEFADVSALRGLRLLV